jgi:hypothetical protein
MAEKAAPDRPRRTRVLGLHFDSGSPSTALNNVVFPSVGAAIELDRGNSARVVSMGRRNTQLRPILLTDSLVKLAAPAIE